MLWLWWVSARVYNARLYIVLSLRESRMDRLFEFIGNHIELSALFFGLLVALWYTERSKAGKALSPQTATLMMNKDEAVIVDIREKKEYSEGRITGSLHIPFDSLKERGVELKKFQDKQIILVDKMGQHSGMAAKLLKAEGFENIARMSGGITEWKSVNLPLVKK